MSCRVERHVDLLRWLSQAKPAEIRSIIKSVDKDLLDTLCECGLNVLKGRVPLTPIQKSRLRRHKTGLRRLVQKSTPLKEKRALLQKGGFLGTLLAPVLGALGHFLFQ